MSDRTLRRAFAMTVGVSPKHYARFRRAATEAPTANGRLAALARAGGYADQAHLANEFREIAGVPPSAFGRPSSTDRLRIACPLVARS